MEENILKHTCDRKLISKCTENLHILIAKKQIIQFKNEQTYRWSRVTLKDDYHHHKGNGY